MRIDSGTFHSRREGKGTKAAGTGNQHEVRDVIVSVFPGLLERLPGRSSQVADSVVVDQLIRLADRN